MQKTIRYLKKALTQYLLLSDEEGAIHGIEKWQISALRILIVTAYTLYTVIAAASSINALQIGYYWLAVLTSCFYLSAAIQLKLSKTHYTPIAYSLLVSIIACALSINIISQNPNLAVFGPVLVFSLPVTAFILLGARVGFICMFLNIIPFVALLNGYQLSHYFPPHELLDNAYEYVITLIFLFFNICMPLAVARSSLAARRLNNKLIETNTDLQAQNEFFKTLFVDADIAKLVVSNTGLILEMNLAAETLLRSTLKPTSGDLYVADLFSESPSQAGEKVVNLSVDGRFKAFKLTRSAEFNHNNYFLTVHDVTAKALLHKTLAAHTALNKRQKTDIATGLPNRLWLEKKLDSLLVSKLKEVCVIAFKITNAQFIEQKYGFTALPLVLQKLAQHWQNENQSDSVLGSISSNNLTIIRELSAEYNRALIALFIEQLPKMFDIGEQSIPVEFRVGISSPDSAKCSAQQLLKNALYAVDSSLSLINCYETSSLEQFIENQEISILLNEALTTNELRLVYQPKVTQDGSITGLEALLRWESSIIGSVSPKVFIPIAEQSGIIPDITRWLITCLCEQLSEWKQQGLDIVPVGINVSGLDFDHTGFKKHLVYSLLERSINPNLVELELTESEVSIDVSNALRTTKDLADWGFTITLDDFGKGYSGLSKLISYPVKRVKIDRQFVKNIHLDKKKSKVVEAIVAMCRVFDIEVLAEGTENFEEVNKLAELGCAEFQGFIFSRPLEVIQTEQLLLNKNVFANEKKSLNTQ